MPMRIPVLSTSFCPPLHNDGIPLREDVPGLDTSAFTVLVDGRFLAFRYVPFNFSKSDHG
jgi:hypothetical protein